jgi:hypothetical protein
MTSSTAARMSGSLIAPHGGELINRTVTGDEAAVLAEEARGLPRVHMTEKQTADLDMIASGALWAPLSPTGLRREYIKAAVDRPSCLKVVVARSLCGGALAPLVTGAAHC